MENRNLFLCMLSVAMPDSLGLYMKGDRYRRNEESSRNWEKQFASGKTRRAGTPAVPVNPHSIPTIPRRIVLSAASKSLGHWFDRRHLCAHCSLDLGRDHNAMLNIQMSGLL